MVRTYRSALREEQARQTRVAVLDAASRCFRRDGYHTTTMKGIAAEAGVSAQTVFAQGGKAALLLAAVDRSLVGDDEEVPLLRRENMNLLVTEQDRAAKLAQLRLVALDILPTAGPMMWVFREAAGADPEIAEAWQEYERRRFEDYRAVVASFGPFLRMDLDRAVDVYWSVACFEVLDKFLRVRGWTPEEFADWLLEFVDRALLNPAPPSASPRTRG
ncbi:TetR/AcrR family transcriptional regulator [Pseudonocardia pini]|uniref:TetR/AcrR family transcriptional regulator n=1 Tax=Pseudonocardia pini TaxID=2758030 RepID=UPI0015EFFCD0|nr:TetR/AcrR family transcriptional regulator [Pseudonocardia pini]